MASAMPAPAGMRAVDGHNPAPRRRHICTGIATTRYADGVSPSGVPAVDDSRRLGVPSVIEHDSPGRTAVKGLSVRRLGTLAWRELAERCPPFGQVRGSMAESYGWSGGK
jgi:hypothetical protein